jgi:hypothetical protein
MDFYSYPDTNNSTKYQPGENAIVAYNPDNAREASVDPYDLDMSPSIQEALHRSNMDVRYQKIVYLIPLFFFFKQWACTMFGNTMQRYLVVSEWMFVWALALFLLNIMICISPMCSSQEKKTMQRY